MHRRLGVGLHPLHVLHDLRLLVLLIVVMLIFNFRVRRKLRTLLAHGGQPIAQCARGNA